MSYDDERSPSPASHSISLQDRSSLSLSGVQDVSAFDETLVQLATSLGELSIRGRALHIDRIDLEAGQLELKGEIEELSYGQRSEQGGFWSRLFG